MNIEIEDVCPAKPKFEVGDVVTIPEASPDETAETQGCSQLTS